MSSGYRVTTGMLESVFADEVHAAGGTLLEVLDDRSRLFARSLLPGVKEVRPRDKVQGGVALKATRTDAWIHPYIFRQVCRNGAIIAQVIQTQHLEHLDWVTPDEAADRVCTAVRECCAQDSFTDAAEQMRSATEVEADLSVNLLPFFSRFSPARAGGALDSILRRFMEDGDQTRFGLINAVTAVARDTRDPELRWRLEELGGGILVATSPKVLSGTVFVNS